MGEGRGGDKLRALYMTHPIIKFKQAIAATTLPPFLIATLPDRALE